ncbi:hypothetical protein VQH23_06650 [Pararoseomonas sp. SCSIO 73927]|uniref:hypothetical protein n=1 Tax=Pararoseomonas sp. SCSIO 73927 TaxID=3114537 RepID=UPI0030D42858
MTTPNDFFTTQSLLTFGGATAATFVVPNALQAALNFNPRWLALVVAEAVCVAVVLNGQMNGSPAGLAEYLVAVVNGCLVYCSAMGITSIGANATRQPPAAASPAAPIPKSASARPSANAEPAPRPAGRRRTFLSPWV